MQQLILIIHVLVALAIIALVLLQHGKGADIGATFGSGASQTVFGSRASLPFLMKETVVLASIFFITSISLSYLAQREQKTNKLMDFPAMPTPARSSTNQTLQKNKTNVANDSQLFKPSDQLSTDKMQISGGSNQLFKPKDKLNTN